MEVYILPFTGDRVEFHTELPTARRARAFARPRSPSFPGRNWYRRGWAMLVTIRHSTIRHGGRNQGTCNVARVGCRRGCQMSIIEVKPDQIPDSQIRITNSVRIVSGFRFAASFLYVSCMVSPLYKARSLSDCVRTCPDVRFKASFRCVRKWPSTPLHAAPGSRCFQGRPNLAVPVDP